MPERLEYIPKAQRPRRQVTTVAPTATTETGQKITSIQGIPLAEYYQITKAKTEWQAYVQQEREKGTPIIQGVPAPFVYYMATHPEEYPEHSVAEELEAAPSVTVPLVPKEITFTEWLFTDPVTGLTLPPSGTAEFKQPGRAYAWSAWDIYNITATTLLFVSAARAVGHLAQRIAISKSLATREAVRHQLYGKDIPSWMSEAPKKEFAQQVYEPLETTRFQPVEQWYRVTKGTPTTPMSKTLEAAIYKDLAKGGLSSEYMLVPRSTWAMPPALKEIHMLPTFVDLSPRATSLLGIGLGTVRIGAFSKTLLETPTRLKQTFKPRLLQPQRFLPATRSTQEAMTSQATRPALALKTASQTIMKSATRTIPMIPTPTISRAVTVQRFTRYQLPKVKLPKFDTMLFGKWFRRTHPIKTPEEMLETFGLGRRSRGRKRKR